MKRNIIYADCCEEEVKTLAEGFSSVSNIKIDILSSINVWGNRTFFNTIWRYLKFFISPFKLFLFRKRYNLIVAWQQFYAITFSFYCKLFHVKKINTVVVLNFTYKKKKGLIGLLFDKFMRYSICSSYLDYFHVPSYAYADICVSEYGIPKDKMLVTNFGIPDIYEKWKDSKAPFKDYVLSVGRSNRDFDFLVKLWSTPSFQNETLIILSDTYTPSVSFPQNVIHIKNVTGRDSYPYFNCCKMLINPIDKGEICSGDTVLLTGMMFKKTVVVTSPSTLAEMYIIDGVDGICIPKNINMAEQKLKKVLSLSSELESLGIAGREKYMNNFSRYAMGKKLSEQMSL